MNFRFPPLPAKILRLCGIIFTALLLLTGCGRYDVGIRFADANHGEITQQIRFDRDLPGLGGTVLKSWLKTLEQQAIQLDGRAQHPSAQELLIRIPFYNTRDLQTKFNQMIYAQARSSPNDSSVASSLRLTTGNWIIWQRNHLQYDLDLRGLEFSTANANAADASTPLQLDLSLKTPWGARIVDIADINDAPTSRQRGRQLIWRLKPGKINHVEAIFWLPSPLGIGVVVIGLLVAGGSYAKTRGLVTIGRSNQSQLD